MKLSFRERKNIVVEFKNVRALEAAYVGQTKENRK